MMSTFREVADGTGADGEDSTLAQAVDSVLRQTYTNWELFVVSDHPPMTEVEKIRVLLERRNDRRIHFLNLPERSGYNRIGIPPKVAGLAKAKGEMLAFHDADNEWTPDHLECSVKAMNEDPGLDLVYCDTLVRLSEKSSDYSLNEMLRFFFLPYTLLGPMSGAEFRWSKPDWDDDARQKLEKYNFIDMSEVVLRKDSFVAAGGFPESVATDWDLWSLLIRQGRGNFRRLSHTGLILKTASLKQHRELFMLSLIHTFNIPFDMAEHEESLVSQRRDDYIQKHEYR